MPIFLSEEEFRSCSHDSSLVVEKADAFIKDILNQLETVKAEADASSITAEQTCSLLEQKYVSLSSEFSMLQSQHSQLNASLGERVSEVAELQSQKQEIHLQSIGKDGEIERLSREISELHKSKRQLMELLEQKDTEINEKNIIVKNYLDKIVHLTENAALKEARLNELGSELARSEALCARFSQEKELIERHNSWLNDELKAKVDNLIQLRKTHSELEAEMSAKLEDMEKRCNETCSSLAWNKDRVKELESNLALLEQELLSSKDAAATIEKQSSAEISTLSKLVELYKESSEEWSKKAGDLDGVIKAMETHFSQVENEYKETLQQEVSIRKELEKEAGCLKEKLEKCIAELESLKEKELRSLPMNSFTTESWIGPVEASEIVKEDHMLVPSIPPGVSGTALAASLLRDGWGLAKIYTRYQEAVDALQHEKLGRKQSEAILERVLHEIEEKAAIILEERAEHGRMVEGYSLLNEKLQQCLSEQNTSHRQIQELKADLRRRERNYAAAQKEIMDLQNQVAVLLKECRDIQLRSGSGGEDIDVSMTNPAVPFESGNVIPEQLLAFKDIAGLVEQNVQLRRLVHSLNDNIENRETELKEKYEKELQKHRDEAASKVDMILARAEEQGQMIESLHTSVGMYKKLYEEEHKFHLSNTEACLVGTEERRKDTKAVGESFHDSLRRGQEQALERTKHLEEEVQKARSEIVSVRSERDKLSLEAQWAQEKLERFMKDFEHQRTELNGVLARNVEFSQLIIVYQQKLRESSEALKAAEDLSRKLTMEISVVKQEKETVLNAEKRASDEIHNLMERLHRLQTSLDTIQSTEEVREEARCAERRKQEQYVKQIEREWAEAKKELHEEREKREIGMNNVLKQVEEMQKELASALCAVAAAEARASLAEGRCSDLAEKMNSSRREVSEKDIRSLSASPLDNEMTFDLNVAKAEVEKLREEAKVNKEHMLQYKSIAQANESALKEMEAAHENFKAEEERVKKLLESELVSLRERVNEAEVECTLRSKEVALVTAEKEEALAAASSKLMGLKEEYSLKMSQFEVMEAQLSNLKDDLEKERQKSRAAQANYERQVVLQSETIQELTRTSQAVSEQEGEASHLRKLADLLKTENNELKAKLETEKSVLEVLKNDADRKYSEVNELNNILHSQLEALHIKLAEKGSHSSAFSGSCPESSFDGDNGLQKVVKYLRRSKEIAETEISLLKQEKLRLQSQLETSLKAAEEAQASLSAERANSKPLLSEEEFKSLQLQIQEISLLRESNIQLREENRHNFEECKKLRESLQVARIESENLGKSLEQRENDVRALKEEIERQKMEKEDLAKRLAELLEKYKNFDVEDHRRLQATVEQMQENLREKEAQLVEVMKLSSEQQDLISHLEQDLARSRIELNERESRINEILRVEATLRSEVEKQKRMIVQLRRKSENLMKEKEDLSKENHGLSKQLDDARHGKRDLGDGAGEQQTMKEKEQERDARTQMLEKTVDRLKEELKVEKGKRLKTQKAVKESFDSVLQIRSKLVNELEKHKQALKVLTDDVETLKVGKGSCQSEGTTEIQFLSGTLLGDLVSAYFQALEKFEQVAQPVIFSEPGPSAAESSSSMHTSSSLGATTGQVLSSIAPTAASVPAAAAKALDEREKKSVLPRPNFEARKTGRKLVRPRILKPEDSQVDSEMIEVEGSDNSTKPLSHNAVEIQGTPMLQAPQPVRKRPSTPSTSEQQESSVQEETNFDTSEPAQKKPKNSEKPLDGGEEKKPSEIEGQPATTSEHPGVLPAPATDESREDVADLPSGSKESVDADKDETEADGKQERSIIDGKRQEEFQHDRSDIGEESLKKVNDVLESDDPFNMQNDQEMQQPAVESGSELPTEDIGDLGGGSNTPIAVGSPEPGELLADEHPTMGIDEETAEVGEIDPSQGIYDEGNNVTEDVGENSERLNENIEQPSAEPEEVSEASTIAPEIASSSTAVELGAPRQGGPGVSAGIEGKQQAYRSSTTINLNERAKERAKERQAAMSSRRRGRSTRGRGGRSARGKG